MSDTIKILQRLGREAHENATSKGFWSLGDSDQAVNGLKLSLVHSEVSEALDAIRHGNPPDNHIPEFSGAEAELADVIIRVMDLAHARGWRVAEAVVAKMAYNSTRPPMHGKTC